AGITPMFAFGHGLGYTQWAYESASVDGPGPAAGEDIRIRVVVRNTGARPGREIVQAYVAGPAAGAGRPIRVLGTFGAVSAAPGPAAPGRTKPGAGHWPAPGSRPSGGRGRDQFDLVAVPVLQVGGIVVVPSRERMTVRVQQPPAVIGRVQDNVVQFLTGCDM